VRWYLLIALLLLPTFCCAQTQPVFFMKANDFLNTLGAETRDIQQEDSAAEMQAYLEYMGLRVIRDDATSCLTVGEFNYCPVNSAGNGSSTQDLCSVHTGTKNVTVGQPLPYNPNYTVGASNPYGIMVETISGPSAFGCPNGDCSPASCAQDTGSQDQIVVLSQGQWEYLANCGALAATEGPNEPYNFGLCYNGLDCGGINGNNGSTYQGCVTLQKDLYTMVHTTSSILKNYTNAAGQPIQLANMSLGGDEPDNMCGQYLTVPSGDACTGAPAGTHLADIANLHNYISTGGCSAPHQDNFSWMAMNSNGNGFVESKWYGYTGPSWDNMDGQYCNHTWISNFPIQTGLGTACMAIPHQTTETDAGSIGCPDSPNEQGRVALSAYLSAAAWNYGRLFWFLMADTRVWVGLGLLGQPANGGGLNTSSPVLAIRAAGVYVHNLTTILSDVTSNFTATPVTVATTTLPATVHWILFQKSDHTYEYTLWDDRPIGEASDGVTLTLPQSYDPVNVYDPTLGTTPTRHLTGGTTNLSVTLTDHPLIIEFNVGAGIPGLPVPTPTPIAAVATPVAAPTPTPLTGAPTVDANAFASTTTAANTTSATLFPILPPSDGEAIVLIASINRVVLDPVTNPWVVPSGFNPLMPLAVNANVVQPNGPWGQSIQVFCKTALGETGNGYQVQWIGGGAGSGYFNGSITPLKNTTCASLDGAIQVVHSAAPSVTLQPFTSTGKDIVLTASLADSGAQPDGIAFVPSADLYNVLYDFGYNQLELQFWQDTGTTGPTITFSDNGTGGAGSAPDFLAVEMAFKATNSVVVRLTGGVPSTKGGFW
jgi:hypothetical protein